MSILNQGLQCIGPMRQACDEDVEEKLASTKTKKQIRTLAEDNPKIKQAVLSSVFPVKQLMNEIFHRLNLKGKKFETFNPATEEEIEELFSEMQKIDPGLDISDSTKEKVDKKYNSSAFSKVTVCNVNTCSASRNVTM